ncbi:MAG: aminopeptidase, partial [Pseudomonadota bacterium]
CYLVIGCASYRGYFSEQAALDYAEKLRNEHDLETHVGGAIAYSTLGWFADPVLSSMLKYGDLFLVELLIHELTHQKLYVNNATDFNEAFATFVAEQATREWVTQSDPAKLVGYEHSQLRRAEFDQLIERHKRRLQAEYDQGALPEELELKKRNLERMLKVEYQQLKAGSWNGFEGYDGWFDQPINNARLAAFSTYRKLVPEFRRVFETCNQDFARFFNAIETNLDNDNQGLVALLNQGVLDCE